MADFGDTVLRESEALHAERRTAHRREIAASAIQESWRRHVTPPLVSSEQSLHYTPAEEYLKAEQQAASRIQAVWRGGRSRQRLARELDVLEQLAEPSPRNAETIYWPSALKLCVRLGYAFLLPSVPSALRLFCLNYMRSPFGRQNAHTPQHHLVLARTACYACVCLWTGSRPPG